MKPPPKRVGVSAFVSSMSSRSVTSRMFLEDLELSTRRRNGAVCEFSTPHDHRLLTVKVDVGGPIVEGNGLRGAFPVGHDDENPKGGVGGVASCGR